MITLLGSLLGFLGALAPEFLRFYRDKADKAHEITILRLQMEQQARGLQGRLDEIQVHADIAESKLLYNTFQSNVRWVDALNATVRPVIAYAFFLLYALLKYLNFKAGLPWLIWGEEDQAIFAGIISFYYGQRALTKVRMSR